MKLVGLTDCFKKRLVVSVLRLGIAGIGVISMKAFSFDLEGIWIEDKDQAINRCGEIVHNCLQPKMAFSKDTTVVWQPEEHCEAGGRKVSSPSYYVAFNYTVTAESDNSIVVRNLEKESQTESVEVYRFVDKNTFWFYYHGEKNSDREHKRVYYKRLRDPERIEAAMREFEEL